MTDQLDIEVVLDLLVTLQDDDTVALRVQQIDALGETRTKSYSKVQQQSLIRALDFYVEAAVKAKRFS